MGLVIANNLDLSGQAMGYILPVSANAEYFNYFNNANALARNLVSGKPAAVKNGSPVFNGQSISVTGNANFINTLVTQTDEMTIITVGEPTAVSGNFVHWSTYGEAITNGGSGMTSQGYVRQSTATNNPTVSLSYSADAWATRSQLAYGVASGANTVKLRAIASVFSQSALSSRLRDLTNAQAQPQPFPAGSIIGKSGPIFLGSHAVAGVENSAGNLYAAAIYSRALTDTEINTVYASMKAYFASKGITV
ncbi:hypothetical protein ACK6VP_02985 [Klebsiella pneumoniae]|uniref:hypothetical protein n=1 Tax=Klebsiella pneumoniae TaxID=573 RepID=UPI0007649D4F|nr:hypothetical protein [Klebsiella pneumoniae]KXA30691.1 hypothetical protein HMPREF3197_00186 [Klebsiella pneumoniae]MCI8204415.1 hypothetical protein [Klebsiella pneumoniae]MEC4445207.1 hypothetical protein [Klebsiella pneumoniae]SVY08916.1 Uncharacterised protein [Klebsiella pneumoniae]HBQ4940259.1 hypothetical protein [Klebsiella pneumoniae]